MDFDSLIIGLVLVGLVQLLWLLAATAIKTIKGTWVHMFPKKVPLIAKFGSWAAVTGSTDGIGRAYALELAKRGLNIVLISRSQDKLDRVEKEIVSTHFVKTKTIAVDFSEGEKVFQVLKKQLAGIPVGILVNNVGKGYRYPMYLGEVDEKELWDIINVNVGATTMMTRIVLPDMVQRGKGAIVNISSGSELMPTPLMTVYAATKTFIKSFSEGLRFEYRKKGITVQHVLPMMVNTKMLNFSSRLRQTRLFVPDAETYARNAVNTLGVLDRSTGYWAHGIQAFIMEIPPMWMRIYLSDVFLQIFRNDYYKTVMKNLEGQNVKDSDIKKFN